MLLTGAKGAYYMIAVRDGQPEPSREMLCQINWYAPDFETAP